MIKLATYRHYFERLAARLDSISGAMPVAVDKDMAKRIQALPTGSVTLFIMPPGAQSSAANPDAFTEASRCVLFVMEKYDPLRRSAFDVLESSQRAIEDLKAAMLADLVRGCAPAAIEAGTLNTLPETEFFAGFAGWSIGFNLTT